MVAVAKTRYAASVNGDIAYQVLGDGDVDFLILPGFLLPIDRVDDEPSFARYHRRIAAMGRLIRMDVSGVGNSDRGSVANPPSIENWVDDVLAVMDAAGSARCVIIAPYMHTGVGLLLAIRHPERVAGLVIMSAVLMERRAPGSSFGFPDELFSEEVDITDPDAADLGYDILALLAPSIAHDQTFRSWWDRAGSLAATPSMANALLNQLFDHDFRPLLGQVQVPTLVLCRTGQIAGVADARYFAENLAGARLVEVPGRDFLYWTDDTSVFLDEIEEFGTGFRNAANAERVLVTLLFTDLVQSTQLAATLGDDRWRDLLERHDLTLRSLIERHRGRTVKTIGDGFMAVFDSPSRAIACATEIRRAVDGMQLSIRTGIHTAEVEVRGDDIAGMGVHVGARIGSLSTGGEILVSSTVRESVVGSHFTFTGRGEHELKGVPGVWNLYAVDE
jgi:class 3 adenylate cyclase